MGNAARFAPFNFHAAMRERYPNGEYALFFELNAGTGSHAGRKADAVAYSLWPSRGLVMHGFELKVDRRDWLRELREPSKAESIASYCDFWWLVTPKTEGDKDAIAMPDELPVTWGWLEGRGEKLAVRVQAKQMEPKAFTRPFIASILRKIQEQGVDRKLVNTMVEEARAEERKRCEGDNKRLLDELEKTRLDRDKLTREYGFDPFSGWDKDRIRLAYQLAQLGVTDMLAISDRLGAIAAQAKGLVGHCAAAEKAVAELMAAPVTTRQAKANESEAADVCVEDDV